MQPQWTVRVCAGKAARDTHHDTRPEAFAAASVARQAIATSRKTTPGTVRIQRFPLMYTILAN